MIEMKCPKDQSAMRSYERNGITIERCSECAGIFLDRGELERLIAAEGGDVASAGSAAPRRGDEGDGGTRRRGWLSDLLDFD